MAGMVAFPLNPSLTASEIGPLLEQSDTKIAVSSTVFQEQLEMLGLQQIVYVENLDLPEGQLPTARRQPGLDEPIALLCTSGTTGSAKIVTLSERNLETCVLNKKAHGSEDTGSLRFILEIPFSSAYGIFIICAIALHADAIVRTPRVFTLGSLYQTIEQYSVTNIEGASLVIALMANSANEPTPYDIRSLRCCCFGGSGVSLEMQRTLQQSFPWVDFWMGYGMTEASPIIAKHSSRIPEGKLGSVGLPVDGTEVLIEAEGKKTREPHVRGEVVLRGPNVMLGYYKNEAETAKVIEGGWLHTGDIGYLDEDGYLYIIGRIKNVILSRGFTIYPEEVEACIMASGLAADCVVYGVPEPFGSERVCADIVAAYEGCTAQEVQDWCSLRLAGHKQPKRYQLVKEIQRTSTGKPVRPIGQPA
jgi:long-chain acyl-CoA synthetase